MPIIDSPTSPRCNEAKIGPAATVVSATVSQKTHLIRDVLPLAAGPIEDAKLGLGLVGLGLGASTSWRFGVFELWGTILPSV